MPSVNTVTLIGRLGRGVEVRHAADGQPVARFSVATDRPVRAGGEPITDWHEVVAFGQPAEFAAGHLARGRLVCILGRLTYATWEDRSGARRRTAEVVVERLIALDRPAAPAADGPAAPVEADDDPAS
jgi:single-strand DNA-binding protein